MTQKNKPTSNIKSSLLVDEAGQVKAQIAILEKHLESIKKTLLSRHDEGTIEGNYYDVIIKNCINTGVSWKSIAHVIKPEIPKKLINKFSTSTNYKKFTITSKKTHNK